MTFIVVARRGELHGAEVDLPVNHFHFVVAPDPDILEYKLFRSVAFAVLLDCEDLGLLYEENYVHIFRRHELFARAFVFDLNKRSRYFESNGNVGQVPALMPVPAKVRREGQGFFSINEESDIGVGIEG